MNQKKELLLLQTILDDNSWLEEVSLSANMFKVYPEVAQFIFNKYSDNKEVSFADVMFNFENIQLGSEVVADFVGIAEDFISDYRRDEEVLYLKATLDMIEKGSGVEEARIALEKKQIELDGGFNTDVTYRYSQFRTYIDDINNNYTIREEGGVVMTELIKFNKIMGCLLYTSDAADE